MVDIEKLTEGVIDTFIQAGLFHFVISPGLRAKPIIETLERYKNNQQKIQLFSAIDERSAAYFALGLSKNTGIPSILLCTSGTALANYLPAVIEHSKQNIPLIIISGDRPYYEVETNVNQTIHQHHFYSSFQSEYLYINSFDQSISESSLKRTLMGKIQKTLANKCTLQINFASTDPAAIKINNQEIRSKEINCQFFDFRYSSQQTFLHSTLFTSIQNLRNQKTLIVLGELPSGDGLARRRETPSGVAGGNTDCLGADIERQKRAAVGQGVFEIEPVVGYVRLCVHAFTRVTTSSCRFFQNSGMS